MDHLILVKRQTGAKHAELGHLHLQSECPLIEPLPLYCVGRCGIRLPAVLGGGRSLARTLTEPAIAPIASTVRRTGRRIGKSSESLPWSKLGPVAHIPLPRHNVHGRFPWKSGICGLPYPHCSRRSPQCRLQQRTTPSPTSALAVRTVASSSTRSMQKDRLRERAPHPQSFL